MHRALCILLVTSACEPAEPLVPRERGWVMVDVPAAKAGFLVRHDDWVDAPLLPTELDPELPTWLSGPDGRETALDIPAGMIGRIDVSGASELLEPGVEVAGDRLFVRGNAGAAEALADLLDARVEPAGNDFVLVTDQLLDRTSFLQLPEGIQAVGLTAALLDGSGATDRHGYAIASGDGEQMAALVGVYRSAGGLLVLDTDGGFSYAECRTCTCDVMVRGRVVLADEGITLLDEDGRSARTLTRHDGRLEGAEETFAEIGDP